MATGVALVAAVVLSLVLVLTAKVDALRGTPRSRWLSFAGGVAISYVFLKLMPELVHAQQAVEQREDWPRWVKDYLLFFTALVGAATLFGIERMAKRTKRDRAERGREERSAGWVFWLHTALMAVYVAFVGYLLFREGQQRAVAVAVLGAVMAIHFSGVAVALADDYRSLYHERGRWLLAVSVLAGAAAGYARQLPELAHHLLLAVLAGAVIFSVIKEEIPPEQQSRFCAVATGIGATVGLLWLGR